MRDFDPDAPTRERIAHPERRMRTGARYGLADAQHSCSKKAAYPTARAALAAIVRATNNGSRNADSVRKYHCEHCGKWHLTGMSREEYAVAQAWGRPVPVSRRQPQK